MTATRLPVFLLTGFLGSGKTTLLADWLKRQPLADTAVIINEAGEVQIDGALVGQSTERVTVLEGGCLCCVVLDDLGATIAALLEARERGGIPAFSRVLIETSGLADPAPVAQSLMSDPRVRERIRYRGTIGVVDGVNGRANLEQFAEAKAQAQLADQIVLTKGDLADAGQRDLTEKAVRALNPQARLIWSSRERLVDPVRERMLDARPRFVRAPLRALSPDHGHGPECGCTASHAHSGLHAHAFRFGAEIDGAALIEAMDLIEQLFEGQIVRSKALFRDRATGTGYALHCVRGLMDTPEEIADLDESTTGVVIFSATLSRERLSAALRPFVALRD